MSEEATIEPKPLPKIRGPRFIKYFRPTLKALRALGGSARPPEVHNWVSEHYQIPEDQIKETTSAGQMKFANDIDWARFYLVRLGFISSKRRGIWTLSDEKNEEDFPDEYLYKSYLKIQRDYIIQHKKSKEENSDSSDENGDEDSDPPSESEFLNQNQIRENLVTLLREMSPPGFEKFCALFLRNIGFESIIIKGKSGDQGIDGEGFYRINRLIHAKMMFQCKRYKNAVGPAEIRDFRGGLMGRAERGVFLTTGAFTRSAEEEAARENAIPIELVDIDRLLELMIEEQLGVEEVKALKIDEDFFKPYMPKDSEE